MLSQHGHTFSAVFDGEFRGEPADAVHLSLADLALHPQITEFGIGVDHTTRAQRCPYLHLAGLGLASQHGAKPFQVSPKSSARVPIKVSNASTLVRERINTARFTSPSPTRGAPNAPCGVDATSASTSASARSKAAIFAFNRDNEPAHTEL